MVWSRSRRKRTAALAERTRRARRTRAGTRRRRKLTCEESPSSWAETLDKILLGQFETILTLCAGVVPLTPTLPAHALRLGRSGTLRVVVVLPTLEVVLAVLAEAGGGDTVGGEVDRERGVTLTLSAVQLAPTAELPPLTPAVIPAQRKYFLENISLSSEFLHHTYRSPLHQMEIIRELLGRRRERIQLFEILLQLVP